MLTEVRNARQDPRSFRRIFTDEEMDLYLWYDYAGGPLVGFQLCYDKRSRQRAVTWTRERGYSHQLVEDGRDPERGHKGLAGLCDCGRFERRRVAKAFREATGLKDGRPRKGGGPYRAGENRELDQATAEEVLERLLAYQERHAPAGEPAVSPPRAAAEEPARLREEAGRRPLRGVALICSAHPSLCGAYPVKLVRADQQLLVLATDWQSLSPTKAAQLDLASLESFLPRATLESLTVEAAAHRASFALRASRIGQVSEDDEAAAIAIAFEDSAGQSRACRLVSRRDRVDALALIAEAMSCARAARQPREEAPAEERPEPPPGLLEERDPRRRLFYCQVIDPRALEPAVRCNPNRLIRLSKVVCERCYAVYRSDLEAEGLEVDEGWDPRPGEPHYCSLCGRLER